MHSSVIKWIFYTLLSLDKLFSYYTSHPGHGTSVTEWNWVHSNTTETGSFTVLEHKTIKLVCCQILHMYLSKVHSQLLMLQFILNQQSMSIQL